MATRIGTAYITIDADTRPFTRGLRSMGRGITGIVKGIGSIGAGIVGLGAAVGALALRAGIDRALNIEDAEARLRGLGHTTQEISQIMETAMDAVIGTQFRLDEAATIAAGAVAAGIKPGQDLLDFLELTTDAAFEAGTSLKEMGDILVRDQAMGRIYTRDLNQLATRGIPVWQLLAEHFGVTGTALRNLVADGEVSAELYRQILVDKIGGASAESAKTTRGAYRNMGAAMARWGQAFVQPLLPLVKDVFTGITRIWDRMAVNVDELVESILKLSVFRSVADYLGNLPARFEDLRDALFGVSNEGQTVADRMAPIPGILDQIRTAIEPVIRFFRRLFRAFREGTESGKGIDKATFADGLMNALEFAVATVVRWIKGGGFTRLFESILEHRLTMFQTALDLFMVILNGLRRALPTILDFITTQVIPALVRMLTNAAPRILSATVQLLTGIVNAIIVILPAVVTALATLLSMLVSAIVENAPALVDAFAQGLTMLIGSLADAVPQLVDAVIELLNALATVIVDNLPLLVDAAVELFTGLLEGLADILPELADALTYDVIPLLADVLIAAAPELLSAAAELFAALLLGLGEVLPQLVQGVIELAGAVFAALAAQQPLLLQAGMAAFTMLIDGLIRILPFLLSTFSDVILPAFLTALVESAPLIMEGAIEAFVVILQALTETIPLLVDIIIFDLIPALIDAFLRPDVFTDLLAAAGKLFLAIVNAIPQILPMVLGALFTDHDSVMKRIWQNLTSPESRTNLMNKVKELFGEFINGIKEAALDIWTYFQLGGEFWGDLWDAILALKDAIFDIGSSIAGWILDGIKSGWEAITDFIDNFFFETGAKLDALFGGGGLDTSGGALQPGGGGFGSPSLGGGGGGGGGGNEPPSNINIKGANSLVPIGGGSATQNVTLAPGAVTVNNPAATVDVEAAILNALYTMANTRVARGSLVY